MENTMMLLESLIYTFVKQQFNDNKISPSGAKIIMQNVYGRFQEELIDSIMADTVKAQLQANQPTEKEVE